ncbi:MAG: type III PLP-dependent enzyme [Gammaproteobacteria bacterium]|nr:type III PLP-dependent enzyme [Gammaproteobacteria bacterium]
MNSFQSACSYLRQNEPADPVVCHRPHTAVRAANWFIENFPGEVMYAVKANPSPIILNALYGAGIRSFDITSVYEMEIMQRFAEARLFYMNPVKHAEHIKIAYYKYGVRDFSLDTEDELHKIISATNNAPDLGLHIRISVDNKNSHFPLELKYGVSPAKAAPLLRAARLKAERLGVCFHVGSQAQNPHSYAQAITRANRIIKKAGVILDSLDVGGGFPAAYPNLISPPLSAYMSIINEAFDNSLTSEACELYCEPGRALVAESASMLVNVSLRKGSLLYINDGAYGSLFDAAHFDFPYPVKAIRNAKPHFAEQDVPFSFYGPTCDSIDLMPGPYMLPADMRAGDYIEIGQIGAYGQAMRSRFNGFHHTEEICVEDEPMMTSYDEQFFTATEIQSDN